MSNVTVEWEIRGLDTFVERLLILEHKAMNMSPALQDVGEMWVGWIEEQFDTQGVRFLGTKWEKLAPATISKRKSAAPILIDKADLLLEATNPDNVHATDEEVVLEMAGPQAEIGGFHQTGTERMPARPIFELGELDVQRSLDKIEEFLFDL